MVLGKLLFGLIAVPLLAGSALSAQPQMLSDRQMDSVVAGGTGFLAVIDPGLVNMPASAPSGSTATAGFQNISPEPPIFVPAPSNPPPGAALEQIESSSLPWSSVFRSPL